jgi:hypothetical protein
VGYDKKNKAYYSDGAKVLIIHIRVSAMRFAMSEAQGWGAEFPKEGAG